MFSVLIGGLNLQSLDWQSSVKRQGQVPLPCHQVYFDMVLYMLPGDKAIFQCRVKGEPEPTVEWSKGKWSKLKPNDKYNIYKDENTHLHTIEITGAIFLLISSGHNANHFRD